MLQIIRDHATGWVAWGIVLLICIPFALWGVNEYINPSANVSVAEVDGEEIDYYYFQREYARRRQQLQSLLGAAYNAENVDESKVRREVLERMINSQIVARVAADQGMLIGDEQLASAIQTQQLFSRDSRFDPELYDAWLRSQGYSPGGFEEELRRSIAEGNLEYGIARSGLMSERELAWFSRIQGQRRTFSVLTVPAANFRDAAVSDDDARAFFESERARYFTPQAVKLQYVEVSRNALASAVATDDEELRALYEARKTNYVSPEQRGVSHILIAVPSDGSETDWDEAKERAAAVRAEVLGGGDFAALAKQHSQDPGSSNAGGSLGVIGRGVMDPAFETAAFALGSGEVSETVRTRFGIHLIKVNSVEPSRTRAFEEVRAELLDEYQRRESDQIYAEQVELLANLAFEHPESLDVAATELEVEIRETAFIPRSGLPGDAFGSDPKFLSLAFSTDVLGGNNSEVVELEGGRAVVVRLLEHRARKPQTFDEAKPALLEAISQRMVRRRAEEAGLDALAALRSGTSVETVAKERGLEWVQHESVARTASDVPAPLLQAVFSVPRPSTQDTPTYDGVSDEQGDFLVIALRGVTDGDMDSLPPVERESLRSAIESDLGQSEYDAYLQGRRSVTAIKIYEGNLEEG